MRLLLRSPASGVDLDDPGSEVEIAASPDTHARRRWEWDVRLTRRPEGLSRAFDGAGLGHHHVDVRVRPELVEADLRSIDVVGPTTLERDVRELWVLVVEEGELRQGRFDLAPGDALVCEGDDPQALDLTPTRAGRATLAVVSLRRVDGRALRWAP